MPNRRSTSAAPFQFDPNSLNATLARIIAGQEAHVQEMRNSFVETKTELLLIKEQATKTNGRVSVLELWRETSKAKVAGISMACGAAGTVVVWLAGILLDHG